MVDTMSESQLLQIERSIQDAKELIEFSQSIERLQANHDFQKVIRNGYFEQEAIRLVHLKADPGMQSDALQKSIVTQLDAIGALSAFFRTAQHRAYLAAKSIEADEEMRDEILAEELTQ